MLHSEVSGVSRLGVLAFAVLGISISGFGFGLSLSALTPVVIGTAHFTNPAYEVKRASKEGLGVVRPL